MRPIKFKAWDRKLKKFSETPMTYKIQDINLYPEYEWCQYTGLADKYGNELYEGDIVEFNDGVSERGRFVIEFLSGGFEANWLEQNFEKPTFLTSLKYLQCSDELELVGNRFEIV